MPIILHIDFDSFFVNAIKSIKPFLKDKPVVCARSNKTAIALSLSYDLKKLGFKAGSLVSDIKKIVPNVITVQPNYSLFSTLSSNVFAYFYKNISKRLIIASIDECFIEITEKVDNFEKALEYAKKIQLDILNKFQLPISIGISYNKFFAKMTTNIVKPFNVGLTSKENYKENFWNLPIESFHGIGRNNAPKLRQMNVFTIGDLDKIKDQTHLLKNIFGITYKDILDCINPDRTDRIDFAKKEDPKGIGKETSFESEENVFIDYEEVLTAITYELIEKLETKQLVCKIITVIARKNNKKWISKQIKLPLYTQNDDDILPIVLKIFKENFDGQTWKGIGVRLTQLQNVHETFEPINLFEKAKKDSTKTTSVSHLIQKINAKTGAKNTMTLKQYQELQIKQNEDNFFESSGGIFKQK